MTNKDSFDIISGREISIFLIILIIGGMYVLFVWNDVKYQNIDKVLLIAQSVEASLPKEELNLLPENADNLQKSDFSQLKKSLRNVIVVNPNTRFAYVYIMQDNKYYFLADSEPETSPDYSHAGEEMGLMFDKNNPVDRKLFYDGKALVTKPVTDRWGTWVSAQVPIKDEKTGKLIAVFGMDYNARSWANRIMFEVAESIIMVIIILILAFISRLSTHKNFLLKKEIAHRKKVGKELKEKELILSNLISNLPGMAYRCAFDENYTMEFMSEACFRITGYHADDYIGNKTISYNDLILPEYRKPIWEKWLKTLDEKSIFEEEYPLRTATGEIRWVWERGNCHFNENNEFQYLEGYIEDVTEWKLVEYELVKLSQAVEQNPVSVFITDSSGIIEYVNPKFTEMTEYKASEVIGQNSDILRSEEISDELYDDLWDTIASGEIWKGEVLNKTKSGEFFWASKSVSPIIDEKGRITNFVSICEDITEKKKNEAELIKAKEKAEESDRLKSAFLANLSHEIRTPMNGILGFAELLNEPDVSPENQQEFIHIIENNLQRLLNIINDLIDISRIEAGETTLKIRKTNINKMFHEIHAAFRSEGSKKNLLVNCHCDLHEDESTIETDGTKLNKVITNLLKNALKFTHEGSITYGYKRKEAGFEFYVTDTGTGISTEKKELIFERFMQADQGLNRKHEGAGLGLAISKAYVEMLGGSMRVESELGKGSTFFFELPYPISVASLS